MNAGALPVLYSFRRCPYAMLARLAIAVSGTVCEIREIYLRDKPNSMVTASPKATVPVLILTDGQVIDQSLDIMLWTLKCNDPPGWLAPETEDLDAMLALIAQTESPFKDHLDRYKYATRYGDSDPLHHRAEGVKFLQILNHRLAKARHLFGTRPALADYAIFPFVRQFATTDRGWFNSLDLPNLQTWLSHHLASDLFDAIMTKRPFWKAGDAPAYS